MWTACGSVCVVMAGTPTMLLSSVVSWTTPRKWQDWWRCMELWWLTDDDEDDDNNVGHGDDSNDNRNDVIMI